MEGGWRTLNFLPHKTRQPKRELQSRQEKNNYEKVERLN